MSKVERAVSYYDEEGNPVIRTSFCAFVDILGLSSRVLACDTRQKSEELCRALHSCLAAHRKNFKDEEFGRYFQMFSDSLVLGYPFWDWFGIGESESGNAIDDVSVFQLDLLLNGYFARGALAAGELHMSDDLVFGKALIEASQLEKKADVPRIILSRTAERLVRHHLTFYGDPECSPQARAFLVDERDRRFFLNYLDVANYSEYGTDVDILRQHKDRVVNALQAFSFEPHVCSKYEWVRDYHDYFCDTFVVGSEENPLSRPTVQELLIDEKSQGQRRFRQLRASDACKLPRKKD